MAFQWIQVFSDMLDASPNHEFNSESDTGHADDKGRFTTHSPTQDFTPYNGSSTSLIVMLFHIKVKAV